jgi:hypothetical protein
MNIVFCAEAKVELAMLPPRERVAMLAALEKLVALGDRLPAPHSSAVKGVAVTLRELRPRGGRSQWGAFYRRIGDQIVLGAIGPEAQVDARGFNRAVAVAVERLEIRGEPVK